MMKIYRAATPDGEHINVLKFSQAMLENGRTLREPSTTHPTLALALAPIPSPTPSPYP